MSNFKSQAQAIDRRYKKAANKQARTGEGGVLDVRRYRFLQDRRAHYLRCLKSIARVGSSTGEDLAGLLEMHSTQIMASAHAASRKLERVLDPAELDAIANSMRWDRPMVPHSITIDDTSRKRRVITSWSVADYAVQTVVNDLLTLVAAQRTARRRGSKVKNFSSPGMGGRDGHMRHVLNLIERGQRHFVTLDIRDAYPSVRPEHISECIELPRWVLRNILFPMGCGDDYRTNDYYTAPTAPCGLPQGSACSSSALGLVVGRALRNLATGTREVSFYVDDIIASAHSRAEAEHLSARIQEELIALGGGELRVGRSRVVDLSSGDKLEFLGYQITLCSDDRPNVRPTSKAFDRTSEKCLEKLHRAWVDGYATDEFELDEIASAHFASWSAAFSLWKRHNPDDERMAVLFGAAGVTSQYCRQNDVPVFSLLSAHSRN